MNLYLYGNCQTFALERMILEQFPEWDVSSLDVSTLSNPVSDLEIANHFAAIRAADIVVSQPVGDFRSDPQLSLQALRSEMRARADLLTFPSIVFEGTHGAFTYLEHRLSGYQMPYHNSHTVDMHLRGYSWRDIDLLQSSPEFYTTDFVERGIEASLAALRGREAMHGTTIRVSSHLEELCRSEIVMNTINHPRRVLLARVVDEIYQALSIRRAVLADGVDYLRNPAIPPLPAVLYHLGLPDAEPNFRISGRSWTRQDYLRDTLMYYSRLLRPDLMRALTEARGSEFLQSFHEASLSRDGVNQHMLPQTVEAFTESLIAEVFEVLLDRPVQGHEREAHVLSLRFSGLRSWLKMMTEAGEFTHRFHRQVD